MLPITAPRLYFKNCHLYVIFTSEVLCQFTSFDEALIYLYGLYFCFDLKYPDCFKQCLGLFHEILFPNFRNVEVARNLGYMNLSCIIGKNNLIDNIQRWNGRTFIRNFTGIFENFRKISKFFVNFFAQIDVFFRKFSSFSLILSVSKNLRKR